MASTANIKAQTHNAYAFRRIVKKFGLARWAGTGWLETQRPIEDIAEMFEGQTVDAGVIRQILGFVTAHFFVEMLPHHGGTGYYFLLPKAVKPEHPMEGPDNPNDDIGTAADGGDE